MTEKDRRLYGKFTLSFPNHPKIAILSDAAFRCLVEATLYSRDQLSDGLLARRYAVARWGLDVLQELCQNDDEKPSLIETEKGWLIHDYAEHQDTKADVEARSARNKLAGQKGGLAKSKRPAKRGASKTPSKPQSEHLAETVVETETHTGTYVGSEHSPNVGGDERGLTEPVNVSASRLVATLIPDRFPAAVRTGLRLKASELINRDQLDTDIVAEALRRWLAKPGAGVGLLPALAADVMRERSAPAKTSSKLRGYAELAAEVRATEQAQLTAAAPPKEIS